LLPLSIWEYQGGRSHRLYVLGERLEDIGLENSKSALDRIGKHSPSKAFVKRNKNVLVNKSLLGQ
jgi:Cd2+/Zn2+-exporting ATPase